MGRRERVGGAGVRLPVYSLQFTSFTSRNAQILTAEEAALHVLQAACTCSAAAVHGRHTAALLPVYGRGACDAVDACVSSTGA